MDIIVGGRGSGKTLELIRRSAETGAAIFVLTYQRAEYIESLAKGLGYKIPKPEVIRISYGGIYYIDARLGTPILIDDVDELLSYIFPRFKIEAITLNGDVKEVKQVENGRMYSGYYKLTREDLKDIKPMPAREIVAAACGIDAKDVCCEKCIWSDDSGAGPGLVKCEMKCKTVDYGSYCKLFVPKNQRLKGVNE